MKFTAGIFTGGALIGGGIGYALAKIIIAVVKK